MWSMDITEHVHQMREGAKVAFQRVDWTMGADLRPLTQDQYGIWRTPEPRNVVDFQLLAMRGYMAYAMPGVGVE